MKIKTNVKAGIAMRKSKAGIAMRKSGESGAACKSLPFKCAGYGATGAACLICTVSPAEHFALAAPKNRRS